MGESTKAFCALLVIVGSVTAAMAWVDDRPTSIVWGARYGGVFVSAFALGIVAALHFRRDVEPDYLKNLNGNYFNRDGFCFSAESPKGKGERVRFFDGVFLRANTQFEDSIHTATVLAGALTGSIATIVFSKPAHVKINLPNGVAEDLLVEMEPSVEVIWQTGDPPISRLAR